MSPTKTAPRQLQTDLQIVQSPAIFPSACATCSGTKGPLIDWHRDNMIGRVYQCARCISLGARVLGLIEGERHTELLNAGVQIEELHEQIAMRDKTLEEQLSLLAQHKHNLEATTTLLDAERGRTDAMRHGLQMIEEQAKQARTTA